jgi:hypothetical protein
MSLLSKSDNFGRPPVDDAFSTLWSSLYTPQVKNVFSRDDRGSTGPTGPSGPTGTFSNIVTGTPNQIIVTDLIGGDVILSLPQSIDISSTPTFAGLEDQFSSGGISIGTSAGFSGDFCTYVGHQAGQGCTGEGISCFGYESGINCSNYCTMIGSTAGFNSRGQFHTCIGNSSGRSPDATSSNCIYFGEGAEPSSTSVSGEIVIGSAPAGVQGKGANTAEFSAGSGLYYTNPSFAKFVYIGTSSLLAANTPIPFITILHGPVVPVQFFDSIRMGVSGHYKITISASIYPTTPSFISPGLAFILQLNADPTSNLLTLYTEPNTANFTVSGTTMLSLSSLDYIRLIFNQDFIFTSQSTITMTVLFFGI